MKKNKDIEDLKDWQSKQYSPGHFIGTGKVPRPMLGVAKFPKILIGIGVFFLFFSLLSLFKKFWMFFLVSFIFSVLFLYGGASRIVNNKKK